MTPEQIAEHLRFMQITFAIAAALPPAVAIISMLGMWRESRLTRVALEKIARGASKADDAS